MLAIPTLKSTVAVLGRARGIGAAAGIRSHRGFIVSQNTRPVSALLPSDRRRTNEPAHAASCSAERVAAVAFEAGGSERVSLLYRRRASSRGSITSVTRRLKDNDGQPCWRLGLHGIFGPEHRALLAL